MKRIIQNIGFILILIAFLALVTWVASFIPEKIVPEQRTQNKINATVTKEADRQIVKRVIPYIIPVHIEDFMGISSPYGIRKVPNAIYTGGALTREHRGVDFIGTWKARIVAIADGKIIEKWYVPDGKYRTGHELFGGYLRILHEDGSISSYGHLSAIYVNIYDNVKAGDVIGRMGSTGVSTGQHLHLGIQDKNGNFLNPLMYMEIE